jgi:hypothetical protein
LNTETAGDRAEEAGSNKRVQRFFDKVVVLLVFIGASSAQFPAFSALQAVKGCAVGDLR